MNVIVYFLNYRAITDQELERRAVEEAFAQSVLWGFKIIDQKQNGYLVDATNFLLRDVHNVKGRLASSKQGNYQIDASRCGMYLPRTKLS